MTDSPAKPAPKPSLLARLMPPLTPEQAAIMAKIKLPCC